jgi:hypothetical protein
MRNNKQTDTQKYSSLISGITKRISAPVMIGNVTYAPADLISVLKTAIDAFNAIPAPEAEWHKVVKAAQDANVKAHALGLELIAYLMAVYGKDPTILADFGLKPRTTKQATVATKSNALKAAKATRDARQTMGKVQRSKVKGQPPLTASKG